MLKQPARQPAALRQDQATRKTLAKPDAADKTKTSWPAANPDKGRILSKKLLATLENPSRTRLSIPSTRLRSARRISLSTGHPVS